MAVSALDHARANRQAQCESPGVVQAVQSIVQVTVAFAHRRFLVGRGIRFQMRLQRLDHLLHRTPPESFLLRPAPSIGLAAPTDDCSGPQILADVEKVAKKDALLSKD